jgi:dGTPase
VDEVRRNPQRVARFSPETSTGTAQLKGLLRSYVYESERLVAARKLSTVRIQTLFGLFVDHPELLPVNYLEETREVPPHRRACDYIAGMTDRFLMQTCAQMNIG